MNTPRLTGLVVFVSLMFGGELSQLTEEIPKKELKYYLSGILAPPTEILLSWLGNDSYLLKRSQAQSRVKALVLFQRNIVQPDVPGNHRGPAAFWFLLVVVLLLFAGYLLFQVRKRQAAQARARVLQEDIVLLFDHAPCGYHMLDKDGTVINMNQTLLTWLGYEKDEVLHKLKFADMVIGDAAVIAQRIESISRIGSGKMDLTLAKKNGDQQPVILSVLPAATLQTLNGERLFSTVDNKRCHDALERIKNLDQELEAFSYSISHDLRAPLRSIDGYSRILQEDYADKLDEEGKRVLSVVMNNARRMGKLIDDLLDFGRLGRKAIQHSTLNTLLPSSSSLSA